MLKSFNSKYVDTIHDITEYVKKQHILVQNGDYENLRVPLEKQFMPDSKSTCQKIMLHGFYDQPEQLFKICEAESLRKRKSSQEVVLFLQGAFNPVHTKHVQLMLECRRWLEKNTQHTVVAAFMGVNTNKFVTEKILQNENGDGLVVKLCHRIKMCKISVAPYDWIYIQDRESDASLDKYVSETLKKKKLRKKKYFSIFGADRGIKMCKRGMRCAIFVGREGTTDELKRVCFQEKGLSNADDVHIIPVEMENVSSTEIRRSLKRMSCKNSNDEKREELNQLTEKGWLDERVADYLLEHECDLYEDIYNHPKVP